MYIDIRRGLAFFDRSDRTMNGPPLSRYDPRTGVLHPVPGADPGDLVCDVSRDGDRLALRSTEWLAVRGTNRSRVSFLTEGHAPCTTDRVLSHWSIFAPDGQYALVGTLNGKARPVVMDAATCEILATMPRNIDARYGDVAPGDGMLWVPDSRAEGALLVVDCATGGFGRIRVPVGARITRVRFTRDGSSIIVVSEKGILSRCGLDGAAIWTVDISGIGKVGAANLFLNESGSHILLSLPASVNSAWGEDIVVETKRGLVEANIIRSQAPPARLAGDWFGDCLLTHAGEIVDFFSGAIVDRLSLASRQPI
jgi:hypothetical protein